MTKDILHIAFEKHQVKLVSHCEKVTATVEIDFKDMLTTNNSQIVGCLEVLKEGDRYYLLGAKEYNETNSSLEELLNALHYEIPLHLIHSRPDLLWLHAGATAKEENGIIVSGASGTGKSTVVSGLCRDGWNYLSDDILPLQTETKRIIPFPKTPMVRENLKQHLSSTQVRQLKKNKVIPKLICNKAVMIKAFVFPSYNIHSTPELQPYSPSMAIVELLQNSLNFVSHKEKAVRYLCELVEETPVYSLTFNDERQVAQLINQICIASISKETDIQ